MIWRDKISFTLDKNQQLKRLTLLDIDKEPAKSIEERLDNNSILMAGELRQLLPERVGILGEMAVEQYFLA